MPEQTCGACKHWRIPRRGRTHGECKAPLPDAVVDVLKDISFGIRAGSGATCPCFERKEAGDAPSL